MIFKFLDRGVENLRQPDRLPRCYELTEDERLSKIKEWNNRNIWNPPELAKKDQYHSYSDR